MLALAVIAATVGLLAWGPVPIGRDAHHYADSRAWFGIPNALNVLVNLPLFWLAAWGWCATRASGWPRPLRAPWQCFHLCAMVTALTSAMYHAAPSDGLYVLSLMGQAGAFALLTFGLLAERVNRHFGSTAACLATVLFIALAGAAMLRQGQAPADIDLRPLLGLEAIPGLLIPMAALSLAGSHTKASSWVVVVMLYGLAKLFEYADEAIFRATGVISGHSLMHLSLAVAVGWMAYRASEAGSAATAVGSGQGTSQRQTSLNTGF